MVRAYSGDLHTAQHDLESMVEIAPGNGGLQSALGSVYMMRGWPRRALQRQQMAHALDPRDIEPRLGMEEAYVALQRDDLARPLHEHVGAGAGVVNLDSDTAPELIASDWAWPGEADGVRVISQKEVLWQTREVVGNVVAVAGGAFRAGGQTQAVLAAVEPGESASRIYLLGR